MSGWPILTYFSALLRDRKDLPLRQNICGRGVKNADRLCILFTFLSHLFSENKRTRETGAELVLLIDCSLIW